MKTQNGSKKRPKKLSNQRGMSLIEVMTALAMITAITVSVQELTKSSEQGQAAIEQAIAWNNITSDINAFVNTSDACVATLKNAQPVSGAATLDPLATVPKVFGLPSLVRPRAGGPDETIIDGNASYGRINFKYNPALPGSPDNAFVLSLIPELAVAPVTQSAIRLYNATLAVVATKKSGAFVAAPLHKTLRFYVVTDATGVPTSCYGSYSPQDFCAAVTGSTANYVTAPTDGLPNCRMPWSRAIAQTTNDFVVNAENTPVAIGWNYNTAASDIAVDLLGAGAVPVLNVNGAISLGGGADNSAAIEFVPKPIGYVGAPNQMWIESP